MGLQLHCPHCETDVNGTLDLMSGAAAAPAVGDVSVCVHCLQPAVFVDMGVGERVMGLRLPTRDERVRFERDPSLADARRRLVVAQALAEQNEQREAGGEADGDNPCEISLITDRRTCGRRDADVTFTAAYVDPNSGEEHARRGHLLCDPCAQWILAELTKDA